jgi:molybdate transport system ATP-binding protein
MTATREIHVEFRSALGKFRLESVFKVPATGVTMLFGPSGCGKTTVLRCIAGLIHIKDGLCDIAGDIWQDRNGGFVPTHKRALGYVFQEASLFSHLSVRKNLLFGAPEKKQDGPTIDFDEVVDLLGIRTLLDRSPRNLSGGERQRVGIGRALLAQPKVLLMDEPLSALDRRTKGEILPFIEKLRDHFALPIFYVTHDMAEVERLADQIVLLDKGHVVAVGPLEELQADPNSVLAASQEAAVSLHAVVEGFEDRFGLSRVSVPGGRILVPSASGAVVGDALRIRILATDVTLARDPPGRNSALNVLAARIVATNATRPHEILASVALGDDGAGARLLARVPQKSWEELGLARGQTVFAQVKSVAFGRNGAPE